MHVRLAVRRNLVQEERWSMLACSVERASTEIERLLAGIDSSVSRMLVERMRLVRMQVSEGGYTPERLQFTVVMLSAVADSLAKLITDLRLDPDRADPAIAAAARDIPGAIDRHGPP